MKLSRPRMKTSLFGLGRLNLAAGTLMLWVAFGPWIWGYASSSAAVASHVFFIFAFGPLTLLLLVLRPAAFVVLAAGVWLTVSPWLLGYAGNHSAWLSEMVTGLLLSVVAARAAGILPATLVPARGARRRVAATPRPTEAAGSHP
jgi:SPW repeat